jgi:hypothetical protein
MPHLHLPADHTEADLVLAANLADIVGSQDLYVAWSHGAGPGAVPEVEAVVRDDHRPNALGALAAAFGAFWRALVGRPERGDARYEGAGDRRASVR